MHSVPMRPNEYVRKSVLNRLTLRPTVSGDRLDYYYYYHRHCPTMNTVTMCHCEWEIVRCHQQTIPNRRKWRNWPIVGSTSSRDRYCTETARKLQIHSVSSGNVLLLTTFRSRVFAAPKQYVFVVQNVSKIFSSPPLPVPWNYVRRIRWMCVW